MFDSLSEKIDKAIHRLSGRGRITDINIAEGSRIFEGLLLMLM